MNEVITINRDDFKKTITNLMTKNEHIAKLCKDVPTILLAYAIFEVELEKELFKNKEDIKNGN